MTRVGKIVYNVWITFLLLLAVVAIAAPFVMIFGFIWANTVGEPG